MLSWIVFWLEEGNVKLKILIPALPAILGVSRMKIAVRDDKDKVWKKITDDNVQQNDYVRDLIYQVPDLVSIKDANTGAPDLKVCIKITPTSGSEDNSGLVGIDASGKISIVECKIPQNSSSRREVMGQALEYAAILWEMTYDELDKMTSDLEGKPLEELMKERVQTDDWSAEEFRKSVSRALNKGDFRLIIATPGMNDELEKTIKFLSVRGPFSFEIYTLELQYFSNGETEIVVPKLINFSEQEKMTSDITIVPKKPNISKPASINSSTSSGPTELLEPNIAAAKVEPKREVENPGILEQSDQKESLFFARCRDNTNEDILALIKKVYEFSKETADDIIWWGSGGAGAFNFVLTEDALTVFIVDASGKIMFNFSEWQREPSYRDLLPQFLEKLKGITALHKHREDYTRWPDFNVQEFFATSQDFSIFEESIRFLKKEMGKLGLI